MDITVFTELEFFFRILIAGICGGLIGYERNNRLKEAGIRTHLIVALAAALDPALIRAQTDCDCYCCRFEPPAYGQVILHETGKWYEGLGQITRRNASVLRAVDADRFKSMVVRALVLSL